jgi:hypothetical protein
MTAGFLDKIGGTLDKQFLVAALFPILVGTFALGSAVAAALSLEGVVAWFSGRSASAQLAMTTAGTVTLLLLAFVLRVLRVAVLRFWSGELLFSGFRSYCTERQALKRAMLRLEARKQNPWKDSLQRMNTFLNDTSAPQTPPPPDPPACLLALLKDARALLARVEMKHELDRPTFDAMLERLRVATAWAEEDSIALIHQPLLRASEAMEKSKNAQIGQARIKLDYDFGIETLEPAGTRLGNILRAIDSYPFTRYRMEGSVFWPLLETVMKRVLLDDIRDQRALLDMALALTTLFTLLSLLLIFLGPWIAINAASSCIPIGFVYALMAAVFYHASVQAALTLGRSMRAGCDLYRLDLMRALGREAPATLTAETEQWKQLSELTLYGETDNFSLAPAPGAKAGE